MITTAFYDPAAGETKRHDFKAIVLGTLVKGTYYVRDAWIKQEKTPNDVVKELYRINSQYPGIVQGYEKNGFQVLYSEVLKHAAEKRGYPIRIEKITTISNKFARIESLSSFVEDGSIRFAKDSDGYIGDIGILVEQLLDFPNAAHDDGPDALYYAFTMAVERQKKYGLAGHLQSYGKRDTAGMNMNYTNFEGYL